ncbi:hypothetical protein M422DRAFT_256343 [Sphaerobolus stellatus SS14]|uniref:Unplaced genomic scaffold SPHSTscaffold_67, whole genome shotgun sequence n=1 Tax=Sphaerobolus stellatus (strain SS14) TaxID=990650 RepID=A0A0C9VRN3_SPHS4|nr:hypothetical protein M422DRAFT_256343 [Sphaerobolus stellatus SS14]
MFSTWIQFVFLPALLLALVILSRRRIPRGLKLPPGPPPKFLVGNAFDMPKEREWETFAEWAKEYGM